MASFSKNEKKLIVSMSMLLSIRMTGVSFIIPVLSIYATEIIPGSSELLAGVAVGIFGISQTIFQIPMGRLSDRWGRKETTILGLGIHLIGTLLSGLSGTIYHLIISRIIAGSGAVSGVTMAWLTEGIDVNKRNSAISYVDMSIILSLIIGFAISPVIAGKFGVQSVFFICSALNFIAIIFTLFNLKNNNTRLERVHREPVLFDRNSLTSILKNRDIILLCATGIIKNILMSSMFFIMPLLIKKEIGLVSLWKIFVPVAVVGSLFMYYFGMKADKHGTRFIAFIAFAFEFTGVIIPLLSGNIFWMFISFIIFYSGNCILSPILPAAVSRFPGSSLRGTVMSFYNSSQFIGFAIGGFLSGFMLQISSEYLFMMLGGLVILAAMMISLFKNFKAKL